MTTTPPDPYATPHPAPYGVPRTGPEPYPLPAAPIDLDGATDVGPDDSWPADAGEFAARWNRATPAERDERVRYIVRNASAAEACEVQGHRAQLVALREQVAAMALATEALAPVDPSREMLGILQVVAAGVLEMIQAAASTLVATQDDQRPAFHARSATDGVSFEQHATGHDTDHRKLAAAIIDTRITTLEDYDDALALAGELLARGWSRPDQPSEPAAWCAASASHAGQFPSGDHASSNADASVPKGTA